MAGVAAFRAAQREKLLLAQYFHVRLSQLPDFDAGPEPDLSVVAFRYTPEGMDANFAGERLLQHLQQEGRVMLSGTRIDGNFFIRCAILSFRSHAEHVDDAIGAIVRAAQAVTHG
jgi:glutamate/tyrosine decarboxylase-like PLP-dependent enzyme